MTRLLQYGQCHFREQRDRSQTHQLVIFRDDGSSEGKKDVLKQCFLCFGDVVLVQLLKGVFGGGVKDSDQDGCVVVLPIHSTRHTDGSQDRSE